MSIKDETSGKETAGMLGDDPTVGVFGDQVWNELAKYSINVWTEESIPTMAQARGKVIIVKRFGDGVSGRWGWPDVANHWKEDSRAVETATLDFPAGARFLLQVRGGFLNP